MGKIGHFVAALAATETPPGICNQYAFGRPGSGIRRQNLERYLRRVLALEPAAMLVGEAAGYRGCRLTGIPFTSPNILQSGSFFISEGGYALPQERPDIRAEQSATIVWGVLEQVRPVCVLWNALPFHPHRPGEPWSNRTPLQRELRLGDVFLCELAQIVGPEQVIAVGQRAATSLERLGMAYHHVRHPSHGGKRAFTAGVCGCLQPGPISQA